MLWMRRPPPSELAGPYGPGDPQALTCFIHACPGGLFARPDMLGDHAQATDFAQEVFLLAWRGARDSPATGLRPGLARRLTRERAIDELRRTARLGETAPLARHASRASPHRSALADAAELTPGRAESLSRLASGTTRRPLVLAFFQGLSRREIATLPRTPLGTIKARIRRALDAAAAVARRVRLRERTEDIQNGLPHVRQS